MSRTIRQPGEYVPDYAEGVDADATVRHPISYSRAACTRCMRRAGPGVSRADGRCLPARHAAKSLVVDVMTVVKTAGGWRIYSEELAGTLVQAMEMRLAEL